MEFFNLFVIPFISAFIYGKRRMFDIKDKFALAGYYSLFSGIVAIISYVIMLVSKYTLGIAGEIYSQLYTVVATIVALIIPYICELLKKFIEVKLEIKKKG